MWSYEPQPPLTPLHLEHVELHEFTESIPRDTSTGSGRCGALPARAFRRKYPLGCYRERTHAGPHSALAPTAQRLDRQARAKGWRPQA